MVLLWIFVDGIGDDYSICVSQIIVSIHPPAWFLAIFRCGIRVGWSSKSCEGRGNGDFPWLC